MSVRTFSRTRGRCSLPSFETWDGICKTFRWPQTFVPYR
jgi:hypothetical protein